MAEHKERPIIFTGWKAAWVAALKPGDVFQTRRPVKRIPAGADGCLMAADGSGDWKFLARPIGGVALGMTPWTRCPYGTPGDGLWSKETWACFGGGEALYLRDQGSVLYRASWSEDPRRPVWADVDRPHCDDGKWRPSIFMPRWASRSTAEIVDVRVQRVQEITEEDAKAEGVTPVRYDPEGDCWTARPENQKYRSAFEWAWNDIYGWTVPPAWEKNPWVWCLTLRKT